MHFEDAIAAKLKGYNILVKFKDGEELYLEVDDIDNEDDSRGWFEDAENFINKTTSDVFPLTDIAMSHDTIKYILKI